MVQSRIRQRTIRDVDLSKSLNCYTLVSDELWRVIKEERNYQLNDGQNCKLLVGQYCCAFD